MTVARSGHLRQEVSRNSETCQRRARLTLVGNGSLSEELSGGSGNSSSHTLENLGHDDEEGRAAAKRDRVNDGSVKSAMGRDSLRSTGLDHESDTEKTDAKSSDDEPLQED